MKRRVVTLVLFTVFFIMLSITLNPAELSASENLIPGMVESTGNHFEINDSDYMNVFLDSTESVHVIMESVPETVSIQIEPVSGVNQTQITLGGLAPLTTYYKYEDDYRYLQTFTSDQQGCFSYTQDISQAHLVIIQPQASTIHLSNNGWNKAVGTWDPITKTAKLTKDVYETIQIEDDGITLDGGGHSVHGSWVGNGIFANKISDVTVKNVKIRNFSHGIYLFKSNRSTVKNATLDSNIIGIYLGGSTGNGSNDNITYNNNFISNIFQAYVDSKSQNNTFSLAMPAGGNFWNDYTSPDQNSDGIVDTPYNFFGGSDAWPWTRQNGWIDTVPPAIELSEPSVNLTKGGPVTYAVDYSGADSVSLADSDVTLNKTGTANGTVTVSGTGTTTRTVTISNITGDGTLGISILSGTARDNAGNLASFTGPGTVFTVDNTSPVLNISGVDQGAVYTTQVKLQLDANDTESGIRYIAYSVDGAVETVVNSERAEITVDSNGLHTITYKVVDQVGNEFTGSRKFTVAISPSPTVTITSPTNNSQVVAAGGTLNITASASEGVTKVEFYVDGTKIGECTNAPYKATWTTTVGKHTLVAKGYDAAGNVGTSPEVIINVPTTGTVIPALGGKVNGTVTGIKATFQDPVQGSVILKIDGQAVALAGSTQPTKEVSFNYAWDTSIYDNGTSHVISVWGQTANGAVWTTVTATVTADNFIDITPPAVKITASSDGALPSAGSLVDITATATDKAGVSRVEFYIDNVKIGECTNAPYKVSWTTTLGKHTLVVKGYDAAGNVGISKEMSITVPTEGIITNPSENSRVSGIVKGITATFKEPIQGTAILKIDGQAVALAGSNLPTNKVSFNYDWDTSVYDNGTNHVIIVWGQTASGVVWTLVTAAVTADNTIDITPPVVKITAPSGTLPPSGSLVDITATATDKAGVSRVEFYIDNIKIGECTNAPYKVSWTTTLGQHTLVVKGYDAAGNVGISKEMAMNVPTEGSIINLSDISSVSGTVKGFAVTFKEPIQGTAILKIDGQAVALAGINLPTNKVSFNYDWDTSIYDNGTSHVISVWGQTANGAVWTTVTAAITADNSIDITPPAVKITAPSDGALPPSGSLIDITATATDKAGVSRVEFYIDSVKIGECINAPYKVSWTATVGKHTLIVKGYDAAGNVGISKEMAMNVPTEGTITNPSDNTTVNGIVKGITATFKEPLQGTAILKIDGQAVAVGGSALPTNKVSFNYDWDTSKYNNGTSHVISVWGQTASGAVWFSISNTVMVSR